jgi:hypothetical protein
MLDEIIWKLARQAGIDDIDVRKLRVFAELLIDSKDKEIQSLESQLYTARAQNQIYKGVIYDSY